MVGVSRRQFIAGVGATLLAKTSSTRARRTRTGPVPSDVALSWPSYRNGGRNTGATGDDVQIPTPLAEEWSVRGDFAGPVAGYGYVFLSTRTGEVQAVDPLSGRPHWTASVDNLIAATPAVGAAHLFVPTTGGRVSAIGVDSRSVRWTVEHGGSIGVPPVVGDEAVYVAAHDGSVLALDRSTGRVLWVVSLDDGVRTAPAAVGDTVYIAGESTLYAVRDGTVVWDRPLMSDVETGVVVQNDQVLVGLTDSGLQAVDRREGTTRWTTGLVGDIAGAPAVTDNNVFAATENGRVQALWADGDPTWSQQYAGSLTGPPVAGDGFIWVLTPGGQLKKVGVGNGSTAWSTTGLGESVGFVAGRGAIVVQGDSSVTALFHPTALEARRGLRRLSSRISGADPAVDLSEARSLLSRSASQFTKNNYRQAADLAEQGVGSIESQLDSRHAAGGTIEDLSRSIEQARNDPVPPDSCSGDGLTFDGLDVGRSDSLLSDAREEYEAGNYAAANRTATEGLAALDTVEDRAESAREAIDSLGNRLTARGTAKSSRATQALSDACSEYARGEYRAAVDRAEEGGRRLAAAETRATEASSRIGTLDEEIAAAESRDLKVPTAREHLALARDRYEEGNYTGAKSVATTGLDALGETRTESKRARELMEKVEATDHPRALEGVANVFGRNDLLRRAETAYAEGRYGRAVELARRARGREAGVTWGFGLLTFGGVGSYLVHRRRGGQALFDVVVELVHED